MLNEVNVNPLEASELESQMDHIDYIIYSLYDIVYAGIH